MRALRKPRSRRVKVIAAIVAALVVLAALAGVLVFVKPSEPDHAFRVEGPVPNGGEGFSSAMFQSVGVPMRAGHEVSLVVNGAVFDTVVEEIGRAKKSVNVVMYIWEKGVASDRVVAALTARARAGVACRIVIDAFGSPDFGRDVTPALTAAGCEVRVFRPAKTEAKLARNHRKVVIVDGRVAITGGFGVRDNWLGDGVQAEGWRDTNVRFVGPAVVDAQQAFAENWQEAGGALLPPDTFPVAETSGPGPATAAFVASTASPIVTKAERLTQLMIGAAQKRVWIANAYFVPSQAILDLLGKKAAAGVDVRILAPGAKSDSKTSFGAQHAEYGTLQERGVRVWEYVPVMMHSKTMVIDDALSVVGSVNLDPLSLGTLDEVALVTEDRTVAATLAEQFIADCKHAKELSR